MIRKRIMITGILSIAMLSIMVTYLTNRMTESLKEEQQKYQSYLGKEVIMKGDTLEIVSFSTIRDVFILDDGREVDFNYIKNKEDAKTN